MADMMTDFTPTHRKVQSPSGLVHRLLQRLKQRRSERIALYRLNALDDHLLRDIGITRAGIADRVRGR